MAVRRGTGRFELASVIPYAGYPHVWFRIADKSAGGVNFGKDEFLRK